MSTKTTEIKKHEETLQAILEEVRLLREEFMLILPGEDLKKYSHPERIKRSYKKAIKEYPPFPVWR